MSLSECNECTQLPAFGKLAFLQSLKIRGMRSVMRIGSEFYGFGARMIVFPKLKSLEMEDMEKLEEWELPVSKDSKIMPLLSKIILEKCPMLRALPCLGSLESLKKLSLSQLPSVRCIGHEFFGFDAQMTAFPKLDSLAIEDMVKLEEWELLISKDTKIMPLLVEVKLQNCLMLRALPGFGSLESLEKLSMTGLSSVKYIGDEFYGFGADSSLGVEMIAFPKLKTLEISYFDELEEWEIPISKDRKIMPLLSELNLWKFPMLRALPCLGNLESLENLSLNGLEEWEIPISKDRKIMPLLVEVILTDCPMLRALPGFGSLESLEKLSMKALRSVKYIGDEFYGFGADSSLGVEMIAFPKLKTLELEDFDELEEWEIPISKDRKIMPLLSELELVDCGRLRALPRVWRMRESLEVLRLDGLYSVEGVGVEFVGNDNEGSLQDGVTFPKLRELTIWNMPELKAWSVPLITPCLVKLRLSGFPKLKTLPTFQECMKTLESLEISEMFEWEGEEKIVINEKGGGDSCGLRSLYIESCPKLRVVPDYMFSPSLQELWLYYDVGVLFDSFPVYASLCSITKVGLCDQRHSRLPNGFDQLTTLQSIVFLGCYTLDFDLKELGHFTMLQHLKIERCPLLSQRFKGDDWRTILAHDLKVAIDWSTEFFGFPLHKVSHGG
ncbi:hypothetical protein ACHQM5_025105 [Ranunculus cassubicifolius]